MNEKTGNKKFRGTYNLGFNIWTLVVEDILEAWSEGEDGSLCLQDCRQAAISHTIYLQTARFVLLQLHFFSLPWEFLPEPTLTPIEVQKQQYCLMWCGNKDWYLRICTLIEWKVPTLSSSLLAPTFALESHNKNDTRAPVGHILRINVMCGVFVATIQNMCSVQIVQHSVNRALSFLFQFRTSWIVVCVFCWTSVKLCRVGMGWSLSRPADAFSPHSRNSPESLPEEESHPQHHTIEGTNDEH